MEKNINKLFSKILVAIGVVAVVFAFICFFAKVDYDYGSYTSMHTYGGDAYTGIQNAAANTGNNIRYLNQNLEDMTKSLQVCFGFVLLVTGLIVLWIGLKDCLTKKQEEVVKESSNSINS